MDTIVTRLWRALMGSPESRGIPAGARMLPAYAALARYRSGTDLDPRLRMLVTQLAAERSGCRWCIDRGRHFWREAQLSLEALRTLPRYETSSLFSSRERAAVAAKHFFNPITGALGADGTPWGAPVGSAIRNLWL